MPSHKLYSERLKEAEGRPDVFQYKKLPDPFRNQVVHILRDAIGAFRVDSDPYRGPIRDELLWASLNRAIAKGHGLLGLQSELGDDDFKAFVRYFLSAATAEALDMIELAFVHINTTLRRSPFRFSYGGLTAPDEAIEDLNHHFRQHGIGYEFRGGQIIRVDSQFLHAEAVIPALTLLHALGFEGPEKEFLDAFEHHRHGRSDAAITEAGKAFENTLKARRSLFVRGACDIAFPHVMAPRQSQSTRA